MQTYFFLGANSPEGFYSLYDGFTDPAAERLFIIKSGPGSGKSTFMRLIAEENVRNGGGVEYIKCSGDPDSLDGVRLLEKGFAFVDGTAPHVIEPTYSGSGDVYVDLSRFYDHGGIRAAHEKIMELTSAYKAKYADAYRLIRAASLARGPIGSDPGPADSIGRALFPPRGRLGREKRRFLSAVSCLGRVTLWETVPELAGRVVRVEGDSSAFLARLGSVALASGYDTIRCPKPVFPSETEALFVPELSLAFVPEGYEGAVADCVTLSPAVTGRYYDGLIDEAIESLKDAKALHDELEAEYNPYVDFDGVRRLAREYAERY